MFLLFMNPNLKLEKYQNYDKALDLILNKFAIIIIFFYRYKSGFGNSEKCGGYLSIPDFGLQDSGSQTVYTFTHIVIH